MKIVAIVQARMGSTRFPNKVLQPLSYGEQMIGLLFKRLSRSAFINEIILATSTSSNNDPLVKFVSNLGYKVCRGSEVDVLSRYWDAAQSTTGEVFVRITGDCPLIDPGLVDSVIAKFLETGCDYASNVAPPTFPDGLDVEVFSKEALLNAQTNVQTAFQREHVTPYFRESGLFKCENVTNDIDYSGERWTVDELEDLIVINNILEYFYPDLNFSWEQVIALKKVKPDIFLPNKQFMRNQGAETNTGQKLWNRAKKVIPGGNMLLSKRAEMFLPDLWPAYFTKAKGCKVWDLDGNEFIDMSIMGIGTNTLGYGHEEVDNAVRSVIDHGNMSTLNCPEEVYLAEKLIELHPWADMVRFARSGGEANAVAIRIARAASGKSKVAFCGYHGWHDWYLAANLGDEKTLAGHLLPGLDPNGVPSNLLGTVLPFHYNNFEELVHLTENNDVGVIMMEVSRNKGPEDDFLQKVRELATHKGIVLIFDECTSGFRETNGGLHKLYGVEPDIAMFGKALGNGYAISAAIGRREVMEAAQSTFISSTFWTERIGPAAGLKTLEVMGKSLSWDYITNTGKYISEEWQKLATKHELDITVNGLPALTSFSFNSVDALAYKTLITQEMLGKGYLAGTSVYVCTEHTKEIIDVYMGELDSIFKLIRDCEDGRNVFDLLKGPVCHGGFKRLN